MSSNQIRRPNQTDDYENTIDTDRGFATDVEVELSNPPEYYRNTKRTPFNKLLAAKFDQHSSVIDAKKIGVLHSTPYQQDISGTTVRSASPEDKVPYEGLIDASGGQERLPEGHASGHEASNEHDEGAEENSSASVGADVAAGIAKSLQGNDTLIKRVARARADAERYDVIFQIDEETDRSTHSNSRDGCFARATKPWQSSGVRLKEDSEIDRRTSANILQTSTRGNICVQDQVKERQDHILRSILDVHEEDNPDLDASPSMTAKKSREREASLVKQESQRHAAQTSVAQVNEIQVKQAHSNPATINEPVELERLKQQLHAKDEELAKLRERNGYLEEQLKLHLGNEKALNAEHPSVGDDMYTAQRLGYVDNMSCTQARNVIKQASILFSTHSYDLMRTLRIAHKTLDQENFYENFANGVHKVLYGSHFKDRDMSGKKYRACLGRMLYVVNELKGKSEIAHG